MRLARASTSAISIATIAALLAGCGGGGGSSPTPPAAAGSKLPGTASMSFRFNGTRGTAVRGPKYTSRATHGMSISYKANGTGTFPATRAAMQTSSTFVTPITPATTTNNMTCTAADGSGAFSCTVLVPIPPGYEDFQITTWDQAPATLGTNGFGGTFAASANDLSTNVVPNQRIVGNSTNTFNFTLNGVVARVALSVSPNSLISGGNAQTTTLNVLAVDADGNIIIGSDPYVDANGNTTTITVTKTGEVYPSPLVGPAAPANGDVTFATSANCLAATPNVCTFTSPAVQSVTVNYNALMIANASFASSTSSSLTIPAGGTKLYFTNTVNGPINVPGSPTMQTLDTTFLGSSGLADIAAGAVGTTKLYAADSTDYSIDEITPGGSPTVSNWWYVPSNPPNGITMGADTNVYYSEGSFVGALNVASGVFSETTTMSGACNNTGITSGSDNNIYVVSTGCNQINEIKIVGRPFTGSNNNYPVIATKALSAGASAATLGPDGNVWFTEPTGVGYAPAGLATVTEVPVAGAVTLAGIATGTDGNIYVTDSGANKVYQLSAAAGTKGALLQTWTTTYSPQRITASRDGNLYFTEQGGGVASSGTPNAIGRLAPTAPSQPAEFTFGVLPDVNNPYGIAQGSDGQIYFTYAGAGTVGYFAP